MSFSSFNIDTRLQRTLAHLSFDQPTPIQSACIPYLLAKKDLIASSKTGSGKTLAYLLPCLDYSLSQKSFHRKDPKIIILCPTRELAKQVFEQVRLFTANTPLLATLILGGENFDQQAKQFKKYPQVIVATPGRLVDHLKHRHLFIQGTQSLVLDEADRMLDLGFYDALQYIHSQANHKKRQTLLFSATINRDDIRQIQQQFLVSPQVISLDEHFQILPNIDHHFYLADHIEHKQQLLSACLTSHLTEQGIIFTATREDTEKLSQLLASQFTVAPLHGKMLQSKRQQVVTDFRQGKIQLIIGTDLAARGLDFSQVNLVINVDLPKHSEEFVHRIGRTGRVDKKGTAISFVGPRDWQSFLNIRQQLTPLPELEKHAEYPAKFNGRSIQPEQNKSSATAHQKQVTSQHEKQPAKRHQKRQQLAQDTFIHAENSGFAPIKRKPKNPS